MNTGHLRCARALLLAAALLFGLAGCVQLPPRGDAPRSVAFQGTEGTALGQLAGALLQGAPAQHSALRLLPRGLDALAARLALIERAELSVDLQSYLWNPDASGDGLVTALWGAAGRGVRVRLLLDDWGTRPDDAVLAQLAAHPNIEVRLFSPIAVRWSRPLSLLLDFDRAVRRMHNKALVVDNQAAIVGGRNIGDEYFERQAEFDFGDLDLLALGPVAREVSGGFDAYWNSRFAVPVPAPDAGPTAPPAADAPEQGLWHAVRQRGFGQHLRADSPGWLRAPATALQDAPEKIEAEDYAPESHPLGRQLARVTGEVSRELLLVSPYFVPGWGGVDQLQALRERGVRVRVVTNSLAATDVPAAHAGYERYRRALLEAGIEVFEIRADSPRVRRQPTARGSSGASRLSLHAKVIVADRRRTFIGSMNIDPRSARLNTENGIVIDDAGLAERLTSGIGAALLQDAYRVTLQQDRLQWTARENGREVVFRTEPLASWWLRLKSTLWSWLPFEELL